jgi:hypothetical protein
MFKSNPIVDLVKECWLNEHEEHVEKPVDDTHKNLSMDKYQFWFDAICSDDVSVIQEELSSADTNYKQQLLHGKFTESQESPLKAKMKYIWSESGLNEVVQMEINKPWHLAAAYGAKKVLQTFYECGINVSVDRRRRKYS